MFLSGIFSPYLFLRDSYSDFLSSAISGFESSDERTFSFSFISFSSSSFSSPGKPFGYITPNLFVSSALSFASFIMRSYVFHFSLLALSKAAFSNSDLAFLSSFSSLFNSIYLFSRLFLTASSVYISFVSSAISFLTAAISFTKAFTYLSVLSKALSISKSSPTFST